MSTQITPSHDYDIIRDAAPVIASGIRRVAIFTESFLPKIDGVSRSALLTTRYLRATGREVIVFAPGPGQREVDGIPVYRVPSLPFPIYPEVRLSVPLPSTLIRAYSVLRRFQPDVVHLFSPVALGSVGAIAANLLGVPVIANYQTDLPAYSRSYKLNFMEQPGIAMLRALHNACALTLAPSRATLTELDGWGFKRLRLWERGVDLERFTPDKRNAEMRSKLLAGRDPERVIALYVGRLASDKHLPVLHRLARDPRVALTLVGDGPERPGLERTFADTDTQFTGYLFGEDLAQAYASADVFVFPGAEETFGQVVLEALASGLPVIVPNRGGAPTQIERGHNGFVFPTDDAEALASYVDQLICNPALRMQMAAAARQSALDRPWAAVMRKLETYYTEARRVARRRMPLLPLRSPISFS